MQEHDRGRTSCGRSEELGRGPPRHSQDRGRRVTRATAATGGSSRADEGVLNVNREPGESGAAFNRSLFILLGIDYSQIAASPLSNDTRVKIATRTNK